MTAPAVADDLRTTAGHLLRRGWIRGDFETDEGVCLLTAIGQAVPAYRADTVAQVVERHLHATYGLTTLGWNDRLCRDGDQAVALLLALANELERHRAVNGHV